jgi:hypothetical protein
MSWKPASSVAPGSWLWGTLAFRLTAWFALAGLFLVFCATASLYLVLLTELESSTDLFLADKLHVLRTLLRERPNDWDALREEVELESAARRYEHFYIRLLDERKTPLLTTPGMAEQRRRDSVAPAAYCRHRRCCSCHTVRQFEPTAGGVTPDVAAKTAVTFAPTSAPSLAALWKGLVRDST